MEHKEPNMVHKHMHNVDYVKAHHEGHGHTHDHKHYEKHKASHKVHHEHVKSMCGGGKAY